MLAAIALAVLFVSMGVWIRMMAGSFGTFQQVYLRILLAGVVAAVVFRRHFSREVLRGITPRDWWLYAARAFVAYTIGVAGVTIAVMHASSVRCRLCRRCRSWACWAG
ncbi:MAG: hypothetical protein JWN01_939 [Patescibacteria group bacterium]|nr:hypothetical protein [Patescibacteria group bacterium]